jgi:hypothetical protein
MNEKIYKNRKLILLIGALLTASGILLAYYKWDTEPLETVGGFLCGLGFASMIFSFGIKEPKEL